MDDEGLVTEFRYPLKRKLEYGHEGSTRRAEFIQLHEATAMSVDLFGKLRQHAAHALTENQILFSRTSPMPELEDEEEAVDEVDETEDEQISASDVIGMLSSSRSVQLESVYAVMRSLFLTDGLALVDGDTQLTGPILDNMAISEFEDMAGEYIRTFVIAS